ncbi:peptidase inhibitor family I36 protein [Streptomyces sp. NPDC006175]|uniref:peptidase inhibitor family I36 protein n=1 Tax=unclassified Streptomyces TaxID=2593676 RepID=UPI0033B8A18A
MGFRAKLAALSAGGTLVAALGIGLTAAPAQASWDDCESGALCAYSQTKGGGTPGQVWGNNYDLFQYSKFDNAKSLYNNGNSCDVALYPNTWFRGGPQGLLRGVKVSDLDDTKFEDGVGSNMWVC